MPSANQTADAVHRQNSWDVPVRGGVASGTTTTFVSSSTALQTTTADPDGWMRWARTANPSPAPTPRHLLPPAPVLTQAPSAAPMRDKPPIAHHGSPAAQWSVAATAVQSPPIQVPRAQTSDSQNRRPRDHVASSTTSTRTQRGHLNSGRLVGVCLLLFCAGFAKAATSTNVASVTTAPETANADVGREEYARLRQVHGGAHVHETEFGAVRSAEPLPPHVSMLEIAQ